MMLQRLLLISVLGLVWTTVTGLPCSQMFSSQSPPLNVNSVRPSDVAVLSSIGLHMHSTELSTVLSRLSELLTLFNPALISPFSDQLNLYSPQFAEHSSLLEQAKKVSLYLQNNQETSEDEKWKLLLLFVQVDQLCACEQQVQSAVEAVIKDVYDALQLLHSQLEKTIVSVAVWDGEHDSFSRECSCKETKSEGEVRLQRAMLTHALQETLNELLVKRHWFSDREDFSVILQDKPFFTDLPSLSNGKPLSASQASQQTDKLMVQMWANLLQPTTDQRYTDDNGNIIALPCPTEDRPFLRTEANSPSYHPSDAPLLVDPETGTEMPCEDFSPSPSIPTSVHELRPADIKVVAAVGDSLTAGNGIPADPYNILDVLNQYRGLSWSIGGDENLTTVTTLPNILKYYNPNVTGYSLGVGREGSTQAFLNQAVAGAKSRNVPAQVEALVARMKSDSRINFESDWKVITLFIGGNDLCDYCYNSLLHSVENYIRHIRTSLDYLHQEVPRALVNLIEPLHIIPLREMHLDPSVNCPTWLASIMCPCVLLPKENSEALQRVDEMNRDYQQSVHELVESGRYDTRSDFTVVIQPFFRDIYVPRTPEGKPDRTYFSADCFHLSQKSQTLMARALWNNMLEPLGNKTSTQDFASEIELKCPTETAPYFRTYNNSDYSYSGPAPTPGPITNWGSDFLCEDVASSDTVPTSVHKLRPADIKVVAALGDSITAGTGAKSTSYTNRNTEYKGVSWSIGGDSTLETVTTLPNILKKFNPTLKGFSQGTGQRQKAFNMAVAGAKAADIPAQAQALITAMRANEEVNFEEDWKLVTIFVGGSDLCSHCLDQNNLSPQNYSHNLMLTLDILYTEVPRLLVNVVELFEIERLKAVKRDTLACSILQRTSCPCVINANDGSPEAEVLKRVNHEYQAETQQLLSGDRYDGKEDFAVVLQPFLQNSFIPQIGEGEVDTSFFSVDCLHISERANAEMAIALWNNMLEPVGRKQAYNNFTYDRSKIHCPSEINPYIFTKVNSLANPTETPTTAMTTSFTTDFSTKEFSTPKFSTPDFSTPVFSTLDTTIEEPLCPSSLPVWVPVVVGIGCAVVGIIIGWLCFSICNRKKSKAKKSIEMKGTGF